MYLNWPTHAQKCLSIKVYSLLGKTLVTLKYITCEVVQVSLKLIMDTKGWSDNNNNFIIITVSLSDRSIKICTKQDCQPIT